MEIILVLAFSTSVIVSSFTLLLGLTSSRIGSFLIIEVSGVLFILLLRGILRVSGVTIDPCPDKTETLKLSLQIIIYEGFYIMVLLSE